MGRLIKSDKLKAAVTAKQLLAIDLYQPENLLLAINIDIGFAARKCLTQIKAYDRDVKEFNLQCKKLLIAVIKKIKE